MARVDIPAKVTGGVGLRAGPAACPAWCTRASCGRRATARACATLIHCRGRKHARRAQGRARRQFPRRHRRARISRPSRRCERSRGRALGPACRAAGSGIDLYSYLQGLPAQDRDDPRSRTSAVAGATATCSRRPIAGPTRCTARSARRARSALFEDDALTVWTHSQGVYPLRSADRRAAATCRREACAASTSKARAATVTTAPTTPAADAALARARVPRSAGARAVDARPGAPVGALRSGDDHDASRRRSTPAATSSPGTTRCGATRTRTRPGAAGNLLPARHLATPFAPAPPTADPAAGRRRRSQRDPALPLPNARVVHHFVPAMPMRVSALRALGAYMNVFSIESFMDELATSGGRRSGRIPSAPPRRCARTRRHRSRG